MQDAVPGNSARVSLRKRTRSHSYHYYSASAAPATLPSLPSLLPSLAFSPCSHHRHIATMSTAHYPNTLVNASFPSPAVLLLSINRPPVNALNTALWVEIGKSCDVASTDNEVRCVVLASAVEKMFTAGLDLL